MFGRLFGKRKKFEEPMEPYIYSQELVLSWSVDSEGWVSPFIEFGEQAEIYIGSKEGTDKPLDSSCNTMLEAKNNIKLLHLLALDFLKDNAESFVKERFKTELTSEFLIPTGISMFEHEETPDQFTLTYDPLFDSGAIWKVHFKGFRPYDWGFDD